MSSLFFSRLAYSSAPAAGSAASSAAALFDKTLVNCTGCKSKDTNAIARCYDCSNFLCSNCVTAHQFMHCFEGHRVKLLDEGENESEAANDVSTGSASGEKDGNTSGE